MESFLQELAVNAVFAIPAIFAALVGLFTGGITAKKVGIAAAQIVLAVADKQLSNPDKKALAIDELRNAMPVVKWVPEAVLGAIVDVTWEQVIKPAAMQGKK